VLYDHDLHNAYVKCLFHPSHNIAKADYVQVRLAGGALVIAVEQDLSDSNVSLITATYVLLNLGVVPLLASFDGFLSLMYIASLPICHDGN
jgi:hypothetical protein